MAKITAARRMTRRRPNRSVRWPHPSAPTIAPTSKELTTNPCKKGVSRKSSCMRSMAPEITPVSKPNSKPPRAEMPATTYT